MAGFTVLPRTPFEMRVLHIEDNDGMLALVRATCRSGFDIVSARSLSEAKRKIEDCGDEAFDILLIDLNLGDSTGIATVRELADYGIPMVVLTADTTEKFAEMAADAGASDYLLKTELRHTSLASRLRFVHSKHVPKRTFQFGGLDAIKPYLSCAALA